jgi:hypothetical protein
LLAQRQAAADEIRSVLRHFNFRLFVFFHRTPYLCALFND